MTHPIPMFHQETPLDESIVPNADFTGMGAIWEDEGAATTNLYDSVDDNATGTYVTLQSVIPETVICGSSTETHQFRVLMATPSGDPVPGQSVTVRVGIRYVDLFGATGESHDLTIAFFEGGGTTPIASTSPTAITSSFATYDLILSNAQHQSVTDWSDVQVRASIESCAGDSAPNAGDQNIEIYDIRIIFAP